MSERIAQRFKEIQLRATAKPSPEKPTVVFDDKQSVTSNGTAEDEKEPPKLDKGKGREIDPVMSPSDRITSPAPLSPPLPPSKLDIRAASPMPPPPPPPILLAGLSLPPAAVSDLLKRAASELPLRPVKIPIFGEYQDCFTGEELSTWLKENVQGFGGSLDRAEDAARDLAERENVLRRIGEFGNKFENSDEAFYQFRPKVTFLCFANMFTC